VRRTAIITGASSGIGAVYAGRLAARGYDLILVARRAERLETLASELARTHGVTAEAMAADLTYEDHLSAVERRIDAMDGLEILVNNAGFGTLGTFTELDVRSQDEMHRLHIMATMRLSHAALKGMVARNRGAVINVSSVAGFLSSAGSVSYCATKRWMNAFTEGLHLELKAAKSAVKVQALCPGFTFSEFHDQMGFDRAQIPKGLWLDAGDVVAESLRGLDAGKLFVVTGWKYKIAVFFAKRIPASMAQAVSPRRLKPATRK
jgi:hypothetical protein